jgi:hypothetical protein
MKLDDLIVLVPPRFRERVAEASLALGRRLTRLGFTLGGEPDPAIYIPPGTNATFTIRADGPVHLGPYKLARIGHGGLLEFDMGDTEYVRVERPGAS